MTTRDYQVIARIIASIEDDEQRKATCEVAVRELLALNWRFDAGIFRAACNVPAKTIAA